MSGMFRKILNLLHRFLPKLDHAVIWGWPDGEDSVIAIEQALQETRVNMVILLLSEPHRKLKWKPGSKTLPIRKNSLAGIFWFLLARYVFFTHPCFTRNFPPNVVAVNVWHGMPIKRIGWMIDNDPGTRCRYTLATSPFWAEIMERAMRPGGQIINVGLPRNDRLACDRNMALSKSGINASSRLGMWLPTYRKSSRGLTRNDGAACGNPFEMPGLDPEKLNQILKDHDTVLVVKPHPMTQFEPIGNFSNFMVVDDTWFCECGLSLYELLGATDFLISDVSSVVIDYLLLDRAVVHAFPDRKEYEDTRGFTVESLDELMAGPVVSNADELSMELELIFSGHDRCATMRRKLRELCHTHPDHDATGRLLAAIGLK